MKILVIRVGNMGDVLMAAPFLRKLHQVFPASHVDFVTSHQAVCVIARNPYIKDVFIYKKTKNLLGLLRRKLLIRRLRQRNYDLCFVLEQHPQYKEFAGQCGGKSCIKVGFCGEAEQWLDRKTDFSYEKHVIENYLHLLKDFFGAVLAPEDVLMDLILPDAPQGSHQGLQDIGKYVIIHPGTTEYWPYRGWSAEGFAGIISFLQQKGFYILITGQKVHQPLIDQILSLCGESQKAKIRCLLDRNFEELLYVIKNASVLVCSDTGVMHIARALQVPVLGLFGPSNPYHTGPLGPGGYRFIRNDFKCGPCNYSPQYRYEDKKYCLDGRIPACMNSITIEQVTDGLKEILDHE